MGIPNLSKRLIEAKKKSNALNQTIEYQKIDPIQKELLLKAKSQMNLKKNALKFFTLAFAFALFYKYKDKSSLLFILPLSAGTISSLQVIDYYLIHNYWEEQFADIVGKYTGFKNDVYIKPLLFEQSHKKKEQEAKVSKDDQKEQEQSQFMYE